MAVRGVQGGQGTWCSLPVLHCFQLINTPAPGTLSCLITTTTKWLSPAARDNFTDVSALFYYYIYISSAGVLGSESSFVTYPVVLLVAHCPSVSLRGSACCLLLPSRHSDLPLDALVHRCYRRGALLLLRAVIGCRPLHTLTVTTKSIEGVKTRALIFHLRLSENSVQVKTFARKNGKSLQSPNLVSKWKMCQQMSPAAIRHLWGIKINSIR